MNPRQRRGALFLIVAAVLAVGLVVSLSAYVADVQSQLGPTTTQLQLARDVATLEPVTADMVEQVEVPERFAAPTRVTSTAELAGLVAAYDLTAGSVLQRGALVPEPEIASGQREVAVLLDPETGVGGKIRPGDVVDVYATFAATQAATADAPPVPAAARVVLEAVRVIDIAPAVAEDDEQGFATGAAVPVTFALTTEQALRLAYVESFAVEVRLGLRAGNDQDELTSGQRVYRGEDQ